MTLRRLVEMIGPNSNDLLVPLLSRALVGMHIAV